MENRKKERKQISQPTRNKRKILQETKKGEKERNSSM
jgi:hypothetical protein